MRSLKKIVVILVLIVAGLALAWNFSEPPPLPEESISVTVLANGPYEVGTFPRHNRARSPRGSAFP